MKFLNVFERVIHELTESAFFKLAEFFVNGHKYC